MRPALWFNFFGGGTAGGGGSYDADAATLFAAFATDPGATRKGLYNDLIVGLKADGVWSKLDVLYVFAAHEASSGRINIRRPGTFNAAEAGTACAHVTDKGYTFSNGGAPGGHLTTGFNPATASSPQWALNSAHMYSYVNLTTDETGTNNAVIGAIDATGDGTWLRNKDTSNRLESRINSTSTGNSGASSVTTKMGGSLVSRTGSATTQFYRDGAAVGANAAQASTAVRSTDLFVGRQTNFINTADRIAAASMGAGLSAPEALALHTRIETFLTAIGAEKYDPAAIPLFAAMATDPGETRKRLYDTLIKGLKTDGVWTKLDALYLFAAHEAATAVLNIRQPGTYNAAEVNAPTFTTDRGYSGSGTAHIDTNVDLSLSPQFTQNSGHFSVYINQVVSDAGTTTAVLGIPTAAGVLQFIRPRTATDFLDCRISSTAASSFNPVTTRLGHSTISRTASTVSQGYRNGTAVGSASAAASGVPQAAPITPMLLRHNTGYDANDRVASASVGAGLTGPEAAALSARVTAFLTAIGAN